MKAADERLREEQKAADERMREEQKSQAQNGGAGQVEVVI